MKSGSYGRLGVYSTIGNIMISILKSCRANSYHDSADAPPVVIATLTYGLYCWCCERGRSCCFFALNLLKQEPPELLGFRFRGDLYCSFVIGCRRWAGCPYQNLLPSWAQELMMNSFQQYSWRLTVDLLGHIQNNTGNGRGSAITNTYNYFSNYERN